MAVVLKSLKIRPQALSPFTHTYVLRRTLIFGQRRRPPSLDVLSLSLPSSMAADKAEVARYCAGPTRPFLSTARFCRPPSGSLLGRGLPKPASPPSSFASLYTWSAGPISWLLTILLPCWYMFCELVFHLQSSSAPLSSSCISAYCSCSISQLATADLVLPPVNYHLAFTIVSDVPPLPQTPS